MVVIGVGNSALSDEGIGSRVVCEVAKLAIAGVEVIDAGLPGPALIDLLEGRDKVVFIDAVVADGPPGTIYRFHPDEAVPTRTVQPLSLHQGDVLQYVKLAEALGTAPREVVIIGVQPESFSPGERLSPSVEASVPKAVAMVLTEVKNFTRLRNHVIDCIQSPALEKLP